MREKESKAKRSFNLVFKSKFSVIPLKYVGVKEFVYFS